MIKLTDILSEKIKPRQRISKKEWSKIKKFNKHIGQDGTHYVTQLDKKLGTILVPVIVEEKLTESSDTFVNILNKFGFKKGARDWGGHQFFVHKSKNLYATYNPNGRSLVIEPKRGGKPVFDSDRSNFSIRALLSYLQSPKNKFVSTEEKLKEGKYDRELIRLDNATAKEFGSWKSEVLKLSKLLPNSEKKKINKDIMTINKLVFNITKTFDKNLDEGEL